MNEKLSLSLSRIFCDGCVFQAGEKIRVFGNASGKVRVCLGPNTADCDCDGSQNGYFEAILPAMPEGGPYILTVSDGQTQLTVSDVWVGRVILASGQSNMQFTVGESSTRPEDCEADDLVRQFSVTRPEDAPSLDDSDGWVRLSKENAASWSAIAYHTAVRLRRRYGCAIGVILCCQGASIIESWLPTEMALKQQETFCIPPEKYQPDHFYPPYALWNKVGYLYENMLLKVVPYTVGGVVWYQGESDASVAEALVYPFELASMIDVWRRDFRSLHLPFIIVQIAECDERAGMDWIALQKAQAFTAEFVPDTALVVSGDVCESNCIHPKTKDVLSGRISDALIALWK